MKSALFNGHPVKLVETLDDILEFRSNLYPKINVGLDTEATGLDYTSDRIVGYCMSTGKSYSTTDYIGYYFPIRHNIGDCNLPEDIVLKLVQEVLDNHKTVFFNRNYDVFMMERDNIKIPFVGGMHDTQMMMHLVLGDHMPALKKSCQDYLKWEMLDFASNKATDNNFGNTDPNTSFVYAAGDPLATVILARKLWRDYSYIRKIYPIDNKAIEAVRRLSQAPIYLDKDIVQSELTVQQTIQSELQQKIFALTGYQFKINSNKDKADALSRFITLTTKTKTGAFKVDSETLGRIDHPLAKMLIRYAEVQKFISSYLAKMMDFPQPFRCSYSTCNVPTGRLSSGGQKKNSYFANFNIQNVPKDEVEMFVHEDPVLGQICNEIEEGSIGKIKAKAGLRSAFVPPEGYIWMAFDYASQEMVLMANFSKEPHLVKPLLEGKDIHNYISKTMFGFVEPSNRTKVKILNFSVNYGANKWTISRKIGCSTEEAKRILVLYEKTLNKLSQWKESMRKEARRAGMVFTYFGRPRVLYKYYNSSDRGVQAFADRSAVNSPVQGCMPLHCFIETKNSVVPMSKNLGKRLVMRDGRTLIPTHRGNSELLFVRFQSGDFVVCDFNHKFVSGSMKSPIVERLREGLRNKILLSPLHSKKFPSPKRLFIRTTKALALLKSMMKFDKEIFDTNKILIAAFWNLAVTGYKFELDDIQKSRVRSLASIFGFNVRCNRDGTLFRITFRRSRKTRLDYMRALHESGVVHEVGSCTSMQGHQLYPTQGVINKNTGGDLIRISIIKVYELMDRDPEFAANVIPALTVHDEIDFYVKPSYIYQTYIKVKALMEFNPDNFVVPLQINVAVGRDWGHAPDAKEITKDNKVILL